MAAAPAPLCHFVAVHAQAIEEEFQRELGMCLNGAPARTTGGIGIKRTDAVPFFGGQIEIEVGPHHHSTLHASDAVKKARASRSWRGDAGCNDKTAWRRTAPTLGYVGEQSITPLGNVGESTCGQLPRPDPKSVEQGKRWACWRDTGGGQN